LWLELNLSPRTSSLTTTTAISGKGKNAAFTNQLCSRSYSQPIAA
jgi:hypothetical protein